MHLSELEVVWPLHRSHYLSPALAEAGIDMNPEPDSLEATATPSLPAATTTEPLVAAHGKLSRGRNLAARALLARGCLQKRVAELLHTSRRSVGRMVEADVTDALRDADMVAQARTCLADTMSCGSTPEEREAAEAWLVHALRDDQHAERFHRRTASRRPVIKRNGAGGSVKRPALIPVTHDASRPSPPPAAFPCEQLDALTRQQQRIVHRSALLAHVIASENRSGQALTLGDALGELLADITEAARMIGTILQQVGGRRQA